MTQSFEDLFAATRDYRVPDYRSAATETVLTAMIDPAGSPHVLAGASRPRQIQSFLLNRWTQARRRTRVGLVTGLVGGAVIATSGVAIATSGSEPTPITDRSEARCYSRASTNFGPDFPGTTIGTPTPVINGVPDSGPDAGKVTNAVQTCASLWQSGFLGTGPVPSLVGCVLPDGTAAVFPGDANECAKLGLHPSEPAHR